MKRLLAAIALMATPASAQTYDVVQVNGPNVNWVDITKTGVALRLGDDSSRPVDLGLAFPFYDQKYTDAFISSNGFINFTSNFNGCCSGQQMANAPRNGIYGYWTDLISGVSPYVQTLTAPNGFEYFVAEWVTNEYGTNNLEKFEIMLGEDGRIGLSYASTANRGHIVSAGVTGPSTSENTQFYYGSGPNPLNGVSIAMTPQKKIDCNITPNDPTCPPPAVSPAPSVAPTPAVAQTTTQADTQQAAPTQAASTSAVVIVAQSDPTPAAVATEQTTTTQVTTETQAQAATTTVTATTTEKAATAERLSPDQLRALIAGGAPVSIPGVAIAAQSVQSSVSQSVTSSFDAQASAAATVSATDTSTQAMTSSQGGTGSSGAETAQTQQAESSGMSQGTVSGLSGSTAETMMAKDALPSGAPTPAQMGFQTFTGQQNTMLALAPLPVTKPLSTDADSSPVAPGQDATMSSLSAVPEGFTSYQTVKLADVRFYAPRDIYRRNKPIDAYLVMYRLLMSGDRTWQELTESQYGRR